MNALAGLTRNQWAALAFIDSYVTEHGYSPKYDEIKVHLGMASKSYIHWLAQALEQRRYITRIVAHSRSIALTDDGRRAVATFRSVSRSSKLAAGPGTQREGPAAASVASGNAAADPKPLVHETG